MEITVLVTQFLLLFFDRLKRTLMRSKPRSTMCGKPTTCAESTLISEYVGKHSVLRRTSPVDRLNISADILYLIETIKLS